MSSAIHPNQIKDLNIFDEKSKPLRLCFSHENHLSEAIAEDIFDLVHTRFFQEKFSHLLPENIAGSHLRIRLKDHTLALQLMRENHSSHSVVPEGLPIAIDLTAPADDEVIGINRTILDKADALFQKCQNSHLAPRRPLVASSLNERTIDLTRLSDEDLRTEIAARQQRRRPPADSLRRGRSLEDTSHRSERSPGTAQKGLSNTLRSAREIQFNLQQEADRLLQAPDVTIEQLAPLHEQIRRLDQQIQRLSEQLGIALRPSRTVPSEASPLVQRIFDRLSSIEERLQQLESSQTTPPPQSDRPGPFEPQDRTPNRENGSTHQRPSINTGRLPEQSTARKENSRHRRAHSAPIERSERPSQREADLESALQRARQDYHELQQEAQRLSRKTHPTIDQLAPLHARILQLEQQVQHLTELLSNPSLITNASQIQSQPIPMLERIHDRLTRIDEHLQQLEGPRLIPAESTPLSNRVDALELERNQLKSQLAEVSGQLEVFRERNQEILAQLLTLTAPSPNLPRLSIDQFHLLASLAQQLSEPSVKDSEDFPFGTDTQFLDLPQEVRDSVYFQMYAICNPTLVPNVWRCGEKFFLNQEGLYGNNGLRSLAITRYLLQSLANEFAALGNGQTSSPEVINRFDLLTEEDQIGILRQYQFLHRQSHEAIQTTRESFLGLNDTLATNEERNEAISRYLQVQISEHYGKMISELTVELIRLGNQLDATQDAYEDAVDKLRLEMIRQQERSRLELANAMFRASSIQNDLDNARSQISQLTEDLSSRNLQIAALQRQVSDAADQQRNAQAEIDRLTREGAAKDSRIAHLEQNVRDAADHQRNAQAEIDRLTREGAAKDLHIANLEQNVHDAAEQQRLAQAEIDRLTREGSAKDLRIANLEQNVHDAAEQQRLALEEIDRLTREGSAKDLRIAILEQNVHDAAEQQRLAQEEIDRLTREGGAKDLRIKNLEKDGQVKDDHIRDLEEMIQRLQAELDAARLEWAEKERLHGVAIDSKDARIKEIAEKYRALNLEKQKLQAQFDQLVDESEQNEKALKARITQIENGIPALMSKLEQTTLALEDAQAQLEADAKKFDEMKQRFLKTKRLLDDALRIKAALEEESTQHTKAKQAWEKELQHLKLAIDKINEEKQLADVNNAALNQDLDKAHEQLRAQAEENRRLTKAHKKQKDELDATIESLSAELEIEKGNTRRIQETQQETLRRADELERLQEDLKRKLAQTTEEKDELDAACGKLESALRSQHKDFNQAVNQIQSEAAEQQRSLLEAMKRLENRARELEEELELLRRVQPSDSKAAIPFELTDSNVAPADPSNPTAEVIDEGNAAARQLEEIVREISEEPIILSNLEQSLIDGYHLNSQLSQIEEMGFDKATGTLSISITEDLSRELRLPRVFTLKAGANENSLGKEFVLPKDLLQQKNAVSRICKLPLIKRLQAIRSELMGATKGAEQSRTTPWRTWGEVFKNFTTFCQEMNQRLPILRGHIIDYKREFARLRLRGFDEALLKHCIAEKKIPNEVQAPDRAAIANLLKLYQTMAKSCEKIFLHPLPRKIPLQHTWKILMLTNHGLPDRAYDHGLLKPAEEAVVGPLQQLIPNFYHHFSNMLNSIQIEK